MRILIFVVYYLPSTMSSATLIRDLALEFVRLGHEPTVVAPDENMSQERQVSCEDGIRVLRIRSGRIKSAKRLIRAFNEIRLSDTIWKRGRDFFDNNPFDLILYYSPSIFFSSIVERLKRKYLCPSYLILGDIFPEWAVETGALRKGLVYYYFKYKERRNYEAADIIRVQSPANLLYFRERGLDRKYRLEVIYNWISLRGTRARQTAHRHQLRLEDRVVFFYGGNLGIAQDIDNIVRLAENLRDEEKVYFLLVGAGSEVGRLRLKISSRGLTNISIHPPVNHEEYFSMLSEFDVGLISLDRRLRSHNFPGKMLGYMYHSMPMLASVNPGNDLKTLLEDHEAGLVCINGEDETLAAHARRLATDRELRRRLGKNARSLLESTFSVTRAADQILAHFEKRN